MLRILSSPPKGEAVVSVPALFPGSVPSFAGFATPVVGVFDPVGDVPASLDLLQKSI